MVDVVFHKIVGYTVAGVGGEWYQLAGGIELVGGAAAVVAEFVDGAVGALVYCIAVVRHMIDLWHENEQAK